MFYIAGKYTAKDRIARERAHMQRLGFTVLSSWLDEVYESDDDTRVTDDIRRDNAQRDYIEVMEATAFIIDTFDESNTGGREVELGLALGAYKTCYRVGPYRNVFHTLVDHAFESWEGLYAHLEELS